VSDNLPAQLIVSHDLISFPLNLSETMQFVVLSSLRDAISSSHKNSLLFVILTFCDQKIFIEDCFTSMTGALLSILTFVDQLLLVFLASSVAFPFTVQASLKTNHDEIDFQLKVTVILRFVDTSSLNLNTRVFQI
jgi:hypothetical protein